MKIKNFVINLETRKDRRRAMEKELKRVGWSAHFSASQKPEAAAGFSSAGARGCFLSHLAMLTIGAALQDSHVLVMEDDVQFISDFSDNWTRCLDLVAAQDWDIVYAGHYEADLPEDLSLLPPGRAVRCAHFVLFNRRVLPTLIAGLQAMLDRPPGDPLGGPMHVDGAYSMLRAQNPAIRTFCYSPSLGQQRPSRSDITPNNPFDNFMLLRPVMNAYRWLKRRVQGHRA